MATNWAALESRARAALRASAAPAARPDFLQDPPGVGSNLWHGDADLRAALAAVVPAAELAAWDPVLARLGARVAEDGDITRMGRDAERWPPQLEQYDAWGHRVDRIHTNAAWRALHDVAATEGIVATAYQRLGATHARILQMAKLYLFSPASAIYSCPLAMTDGAAAVLRDHAFVRKDHPTPLSDGLRSHLQDIYARLTSTDPATFWTAGQWMTERPGGSDVSRTETIAVPLEGAGDPRAFALYGFKWFSSATDSQIALALARIGADRALTLFLVEVRAAAHSTSTGDGLVSAHAAATSPLNGIEVVRLKNKLGTRALPTAELRLRGALAWQLGERRRGVSEIAQLINVTRVYNAVCAVGGMARGLALARDLADKRHAFGKPLRDLPLHAETLRRVQCTVRGNVVLVFFVTALMNASARKVAGSAVGTAGACNECERCSPGQKHSSTTAVSAPPPLAVACPEMAAKLLRLLTPVTKLFTGKHAVTVASEVMELVGGVGYIEDSGVPALLRDGQVLAIWEGTTNVLALDVLRVVAKQPECWHTTINLLAKWASDQALLASNVGALKAYAEGIFVGPEEVAQVHARDLAFNLAHITVAVLLYRAGMSEWELWAKIFPLNVHSKL